MTSRDIFTQLQKEFEELLSEHNKNVNEYMFGIVTQHQSPMDIAKHGIEITERMEKTIGKLLDYADSGEVDWNVGDYDEFRNTITTILTEIEGSRMIYKHPERYVERRRSYDRYR